MEYFVRERPALSAKNRITSHEQQIASYERQLADGERFLESIKGEDRYEAHLALHEYRRKDFAQYIEREREKITECQRIIAEEGTPDDEVLQSIDYYVGARNQYQESRYRFIKDMLGRLDALRENRDEALRVAALIPDGDPLYESFENYIMTRTVDPEFEAALAYDPYAKWQRNT